MKWLMIYVAAALLTLAAPGVTAQGLRDRGAGGTGNAGVNPSQADNQQQELTGKVLGIKQVNVESATEPTRVAFIELKDGQRIAVDLGPVSGLRGTDLKKGDTLSVLGTVQTSGDNPVFVADEADIGGRHLDINHPEPPANPAQASTGSRGMSGAGSSTSEEAPRQYQFTGQLIEQRQVGVKGSSRQHTVAVVQTKEGRKLLADLGPTDQLDPATLRNGEQISVQGTAVRAKGRPILKAEQVTAGGRTFSIRQEERAREK